MLVVAGILAILLILRFVVFRPQAVPVTVAEVGRGRVEDIVVNSRAGVVESRLHSEMSPGISGLVADIYVEKGERVEKGQALLRLDDSELRPRTTAAERALDAARSAAEDACLASEQALRNSARAESLYAQGIIARQQYEESLTQADRAAATCTAGRDRVREAQAQVAAARASLANAVITAPFSGVVLDVRTEVGEWISPSPPGISLPPILDIIDPDSLYVRAPLDEADVARVRVGLPVRISLDAFPDQSFPGTLVYRSSYVETTQEQNRTLTVEAVFGQQTLPENLLPGLSADIEVILDERTDVLRIPTSAILEGNRVLAVRDGKLVDLPIAIGLQNWSFSEVDSGLHAGDRVVVSLDRPEVKAGARVRVTEETEP